VWDLVRDPRHRPARPEDDGNRLHPPRSGKNCASRNPRLREQLANIGHRRGGEAPLRRRARAYLAGGKVVEKWGKGFVRGDFGGGDRWK